MDGTEFENKNKSWFHFRCHSERESMIRFNMMNLNKHTKLFNQVLVMSFYSIFLYNLYSIMRLILYDSYTADTMKCSKRLVRDDFLAFAFFQNVPKSKAFSFGSFRVTCFFSKCPTFTIQPSKVIRSKS